MTEGQPSLYEVMMKQLEIIELDIVLKSGALSSVEKNKLVGALASIVTAARSSEATTDPNKAKSLPMTKEHSLQIRDLRGIIDAAIVTVRPDEFDAVLVRLPGAKQLTGGRNIYELATVTTPEGDLQVVVCRCPEQGTSKAQTVVRNLIEDLEPLWIFLVGIAGGFPDSDFTLGDVVVASRVHDFSVTAALEGKLPELDVRGGPMHRDVQMLVAHLPAQEKRILVWSSESALRVSRPKERILRKPVPEMLYGPNDWKKKVHESLYAQLGGKTPRKQPKLWIAPNGSANTLLKDATLAKHWRGAARSAATVEMELIGAYEAVHDSGGNCRLVSIRGVSDVVGYKRQPGWTGYACHSAASFADALLRSGILRTIPRESTTQNPT